MTTTVPNPDPGKPEPALTTPPSPAPPTPTPIVAPSGPPTWPIKIEVVLLVLVLLLSFFVGSFAAGNSDVWMQLAIGKRLSEGTFQFGVDPFSWATEATATSPAVYWVHQGWLASWLFYQIFQVFGGGALVLVKAVLFTIAIGLLSRIGWTDKTRWFVLIGLTMAVLAVSPRLLLQPMVVSFLFVAITLFVLDRARLFTPFGEVAAPVCSRCLWYLPPLFALWANLDVWFILGPILVGLCWAAAGLSHWLRKPLPVAGKTLGLVFGAGVLACLLNPHHVYVFQLPAELAYLVVALTDSVGLRLPNALVGGGRTLRILHQAEPGFNLTISTLSPAYWRNPTVGLNIAGIAFFPLFLLGLIGFTLTALIQPRPGAPTLQIGRFLIWALFAVMALLLFRLIPFFALIAAPLSAMTLGEFLHWQKSQAETESGRSDRGLHMARLVSIPFVLLLIFFAWPGWLHGTTEYNSSRRVAWAVRTDTSLKQAALTLHALKQKQECGNVFNFSYDLPHYCAWYAPDVKCFMDVRFALFADQTASFTKARLALADPAKPDADWQTLFEARKIDQVVLANFLKSPFFEHWWNDTQRWRERFGDNRTMVFSWSGPDRRWPEDQANIDWNRRAFGPVPEDQRPPEQGTPQPQQLSLWTLYSHGVAPSPAIAGQSPVLHLRYMAQNQILLSHAIKRRWGAFGAAFSAYAGLPEGGWTVLPTLAFLYPEVTVTRPPDFGPPALPILMVRAARQAVAENPHDATSQDALMNAYETLRHRQEDYWIGYQPGPYQHPSGLRDRLRSLQQLAAIFNQAQIQPDRFEHQHNLFLLYKQAQLFDLALEHMQMAEKALEIRKTFDKNITDNHIKQYREEVKSFESNVRQRLVKFQERMAGKKGLELAVIALASPFNELMGERNVETRLGLGKKALEILHTLTPASLPANEQLGYLHLRFDLLIEMGHFNVVAEDLKEENVRKALPPLRFAYYQTLVAGVLGEYQRMNRELLVYEEELRKGVALQHGFWFASLLAPPGIPSPLFHGCSLRIRALQHLGYLNERQNDLYNMITLRGIAALEAGDTPNARDIFRKVLKETDADIRFSDQPIVRRYAELLNAH